jgi:hypothetical protein
MGFGGLIAIAGGMLFVAAVLAAVIRRPVTAGPRESPRRCGEAGAAGASLLVRNQGARLR